MWLAFDDPTILVPQNKCMFNLRAPVPIINPGMKGYTIVHKEPVYKQPVPQPV